MSNGWQVCITCWSIIPVGHVSVCAVGCLPPLVAVSSPPSPCLCFCRTAGDGSPPDSPSPPSATQQHSESGLRMDLVFGHNTSDISQSSIIGRKHCKCFFPTANFTCPRPLGRGLCHYQGNPLRPWLQELAVSSVSVGIWTPIHLCWQASLEIRAHSTSSQSKNYFFH